MVTKKKQITKTKAPPPAPAAETEPIAPAPIPAKPMHAFPTEEYDPFLLFDDDDWLVLEPAFIAPGGEDLADRLGQMFALIVRALETGPVQAARAIHTLKDAGRICYKYTRTHRQALALYNLSFTHPMLDVGGPLELIEGELKRIGVVIPERKEDEANA
jgi:hypothetical protein